MRMRPRLWGLMAVLLLSGCGGGGDSGPAPTTAYVFPAQPASAFAVSRVSTTSPFHASCNGMGAGTLYVNAEVEPQVAANPSNPLNLIAIWQQDRWSNGGARGALVSVSTDGGNSWQMAMRQPPFTPCSGGTVANGGFSERASDPWVSIAADGSAYAMVLTFTGGLFETGSSGAMLVSRSVDGGLNWSDPVTLIRDTDGAHFFNDKNAITADLGNAGYVYAVWDRLVKDGGGPSYFARTIDGGASWEAARSIYDPGPSSQTVGNQIVVLADGTLVNLFTEIDTLPSNQADAFYAVIRSADHGVTWSAPIKIADALSVGVRDPETGASVRDAGDLAAIAQGPDGSLTVVWEDARFSNGLRNGIALSRSVDGGLHWSAPVQINGDASVSAFIPTVKALSNGTIGVSYFDFRENTADASSLPTDVWLTSSSNGLTWREQKILGPFDLAAAPNAEGLFVGDYQGLTAVGNVFVPLLAQANHANAANPTDIFALQITPLAASVKAARAPAPASAVPMTPEFKEQVRKHLQEIQQRRRMSR